VQAGFTYALRNGLLLRLLSWCEVVEQSDVSPTVVRGIVRSGHKYHDAAAGQPAVAAASRDRPVQSVVLVLQWPCVGGRGSWQFRRIRRAGRILERSPAVCCQQPWSDALAWHANTPYGLYTLITYWLNRSPAPEWPSVHYFKRGMKVTPERKVAGWQAVMAAPALTPPCQECTHYQCPHVTWLPTTT
jgi:hypothetical protein